MLSFKDLALFPHWAAHTKIKTEKEWWVHCRPVLFLADTVSSYHWKKSWTKSQISYYHSNIWQEKAKLTKSAFCYWKNPPSTIKKEIFSVLCALLTILLRAVLYVCSCRTLLWAVSWCSPQLEHHQSHYIRKKAEISTADISKTRQLTPKLSRFMNSTTGKRKNVWFWSWGELSL